MTRWEPSVLRACAMAACSMVAAVPRATARSACARSRSPRPCSCSPTRSSCTRSGFLLSCGASARHRDARPAASARASAGPRGCGRRSRSPLAAQIGVAPVLLPVFGSIPLVAAAREPPRGAARRPAHDLGPRSPASPAASSSRTGRRSRPSLQRPDACSSRDARARGSRRRSRRFTPSRSTAAPPGAHRSRWPRSSRPRRAAAVVLRARCAGRYRLGDRVARPHGAHARDGHPQPDARLVLRRRRDVRARRRSCAGPSSSSTEGADLLDVGGVKAGPGPEVERGRGARPGGPVRSRRCATRFDIADLGRHVAGVGARRRVRGRRGGRQRHQRVRRSRLPRGRGRRTTRRSSPPTSGCSPACPIPSPHYDDLVGRRPRLPRRPGRARPRPPASAPEQIALDAGLDLGKTPAQSAVLLRESDVLATLGYTLLLSASNKRFLGDLLGARRSTTAATRRSPRSPTASPHGCRIVRVHDVAGSVQGVPDGRSDPRTGRNRGRGAGPVKDAAAVYVLRGENADPARRGARAAARRPPRRRRPHARRSRSSTVPGKAAPDGSDDVPGGAEGAGRGRWRRRSTRRRARRS